jgi:hypothetical protein
MGMKTTRRKWFVLATAGIVAGVAMLLLLRSIPIAAGTATAVIVSVVVLKHVGLAIIVGSPLAALFKNIKPSVRSYCPFAER